MFLQADTNASFYPSSSNAHQGWNRLMGIFCDVAHTTPSDDSRMIYVLARSPESPAAAKILSNIVALREEGITVAALFREVPKRGLSRKLIFDMVEHFGENHLKNYVRLLPDYGNDSPKAFIRLGRTSFHYGAPINKTAFPLNEKSVLDTRNRPDIAHTSYLAFQSFWAESRSLTPSLLSFFSPSVLKPQIFKKTAHHTHLCDA